MRVLILVLVMLSPIWQINLHSVVLERAEPNDLQYLGNHHEDSTDLSGLSDQTTGSYLWMHINRKCDRNIPSLCRNRNQICRTQQSRAFTML